MGFTVGAKHVVLCGLAVLLLTYAAFREKFPHGDGVSFQGRKSLTDSQLTQVLGDDVVTTEGVTFEAEGTTTEAVAVVVLTEENVTSSEENVEFTHQDSEELPEEKAVREMVEIGPSAGATDPVVIPDPSFAATAYLLLIQQNNQESARSEVPIQDCLAIDGCGTIDAILGGL